ncbi:MAG: hypothetical protein ABID04_02095 [Patescibacteria group bacterium]
MKVLVLSPEKKDRKSRQRRRLIVRSLEGLKTQLLNPAYGRPPEKKTFRPSLFPAVFYQHELKVLLKADLVIADLTEADFKTGFLVSQALSLKKPVLGLFEGTLSGSAEFNWKNDDLLFTECFNRDNIHSIIDHFLIFVKRERGRKGKLIVIEGGDGSGKATQLEALVNYFKSKGEKIKTLDFPLYYSSFHGGMVGRYLKGEFGGLSQVNPYLASLTFSLDRLLAKSEIEEWLKKGYIIIANRYVTSNMAHQTVRVNGKEQEKFLSWLLEMEYKVHRLPKEDLVVFLHVPSEIGQKLVDKKGQRGYVKGRDIHEANQKYLEKVGKMYLRLSKRFRHWEKVDCLGENGKLLSIDEIHQKIISVLAKRGIISEKDK